MEQHSTAIYQCPGCGQTYTGAELTETHGKASVVRSTPCHGSTPLLVTPSLVQQQQRPPLERSA